MCGIIAYTGRRPAAPLIMEGLKRLEYRGYDSAGVAFVQHGKLNVVRAPGKLGALEDKLETVHHTDALSGIGHTRWATHGLPVEKNAHPHTDGAGLIALVHNGIIENYQTLKDRLAKDGAVFVSDTDTEALAHLIAANVKSGLPRLDAFAKALAEAEGSFAVGLVFTDDPETIYGARRHSPLVLGVGQGENFIASDIPAFLPYTRDVVFLDDGELVVITPDAWRVMRVSDLSPVEKPVKTITWDVAAAQKGGYKHFMLKEIFEQPRVVADCLTGRLDADGDVDLPELADMAPPKRLHIVACGTSHHAGLWSEHVFEDFAKLPVNSHIASEFRYRNPIIEPGDAVLCVSQSGETEDTKQGLKKVKTMGFPTIGLCNVMGSSIAREADVTLYTQAGPEISVASTKAMCSQMVVLTLVALYWSRRKGTTTAAERVKIINELRTIPEKLESALPGIRERAKFLALTYADSRSFLYLGRGHCRSLAMEGALKLKEISYIHAEGYAAGEMKHGPIALIDPHFPTFAIALSDALFPKVESNLREVQARSGKIVALTNAGTELAVDHTWIVPAATGFLGAFFVLPALQLFAYETAVHLGKDVDQPRNLAKSVTVE